MKTILTSILASLMIVGVAGAYTSSEADLLNALKGSYSKIILREEVVIDKDNNIDLTQPEDDVLGARTGPTRFTGLSDTPDSYSGAAGQFVSVNSAEDGVEFNSTLGAPDTPLTAGYFTSLVASTTVTDVLQIRQEISPGPLTLATTTSTVDFHFKYDTDTGVNWESANSLALYTGNSPRLTVDGDGNVGIGDVSPNAQLDIALSTGGTIEINRADATVVAGEQLGSITFTSNDNAVSRPGSKIVAKAEGAWESTNSKSSLGFYTARTVANGPEVRMYIDEDGNVGIGTTGPGSSLEVAGGDVYVSTIASGIVLTSPDGTCARGTIDNSDVLTFASITCP